MKCTQNFTSGICWKTGTWEKRGDKGNITMDIKEVCFYDERWVEPFRGYVRGSDFVMASLQSWHIESFRQTVCSN